jgi:phage terminase large subunit GpA-like protein
MSKRSNRKGGAWRTRCYQREPMREMTNPEARSVCIVGASQTFGKSELILNFSGRQIHLNPGPMMIVEPTNDFAKRFSRKRVDPMIEDCAVLSGIVAAKKSRGGSNTLNAKEFPGGELRVVGAETPGNLASDPTRDVMFDEVDRCQKSCGREGDVIQLGEARQEDFGKDAFSLYVSSPSGVRPKPLPLPDGEAQPENVSRILMLFEETDKRHWFCPCQKCGKHQTLKWSQVVWQENRPETARYVCEFAECLHPHDDRERVAMIEAGEWRATAPFTGKRGYFLNAIASLSQPQRSYVSKLHQLAATFLSAKRRGQNALMAWFNTQLCECFAEDTSETMAPMPLFSRREPYGDTLPAGIAILTAGVDVQEDRIELQVVGWGEEEESWAVDHHRFYGSPKQAGVWKELDKALLGRYPHALGVELGIERVCVDTGHATDEAYDFCRAHSGRGIIAIKGMTQVGGRGKPLMNIPRKSGVRKVRLFLVSKHTGLKTLHARLKLDQPGPGYIHFPSDRDPLFDVNYFQQLTANSVHMIRDRGFEWEEFNPGTRRDEAADTFIYAMGALRQRPTNFRHLLEQHRLMGEQAREPAPAQAPKPQPSVVVVESGGWTL